MAPGSPCGTQKTTESALELQIKLAERKKLVRQCLDGIRTSVHEEHENLACSLLWAQNGPPDPTLALFDPQDDEFSLGLLSKLAQRGLFAYAGTSPHLASATVMGAETQTLMGQAKCTPKASQVGP